MRFSRLVTVALIVGFGLGALAASPGEAQPKIPPDFAYEQGKDSPGAVSFSHEKHKEKTEKCTACHTKIFKMKKGQTGTPTMDKMKAGEQCGACHNGKTKMGSAVVFNADDKANCEKCHKKK
jgi:c(7)-type cytochrome triheme protein